MFRFTIRDVLWLMVVVAVLAAWWVDRSRLAGDATLGREFRSMAEFLAAELNGHGYKLTVHPDGTLSGSGNPGFKTLR